MKRLVTQIDSLVKAAHFSLRPDVERLIKAAFRSEKEPKARLALKWILDNAKIAKKSKLALCQDTGLPMIFIEAGSKVKLSYSLVQEIKKALFRSYKSNYLRRSIVDPLVRKNPKYQGFVESIHFVPSLDGLRITLFPKGFGSENKTRLKMFRPTVEMSQIEDFIVESIKFAGPEACPPFFVGVGIGGTSEQALYLAKRALTAKMGSSNRDKNLDIFERNILNRANRLGIGPMGFGGRFTVLGVKAQKYPTHIAGLPVGVNISCHALRSATVKIKDKG